MKRNTPYPDPDTGKITYWTMYKDGEPFADYVATMNKWYTEGLIDPDFMTNDGAAKDAMMTNQKAAFTLMMPQAFASYKEAIIAANPELDGIVHFYGLVPVIGPAGKAYNINSMKSWAASGSGTVVTTAAEKSGKVERILEMIDYLYSPEGTLLNCWGVEGISFYVDDKGVKQWSDLVTNDPTFNFGDAVFKYAIPTFGDWPKVMSYEAWLSQETKDEDSRRAHENLLKGDPGLSMPSAQLTAEESEEYNRIRGDANTMIDEYYIQMIIGVRPLTDVQVLLAELDRIGLPRAVEIYQGAYDRFDSK
jgi:putative aldouronate transport system substrate-binding protein